MNTATSVKPVFIPLIIVTLILIISNVFVSANLSTTGEKIKNLEEEKRLLSEENLELRRSILEKTSLQELEKHAQSLSFEKPTTIISLETPDPVAFTGN